MHQQVKTPDVIIADVHDYQGFIADVFWKGPPYCGVDYRTVVAERYALYSKLDAQTPGRRTRFVHALEGAGLILAVAAGMPIYAPLVLVVFFGIPLAVLVAVLDLLHVVNQKAVTGWLNQTILAQWAATLYDQLFNKTFYGWFIFLGGALRAGQYIGWAED